MGRDRRRAGSRPTADVRGVRLSRGAARAAMKRPVRTRGLGMRGGLRAGAHRHLEVDECCDHRPVGRLDHLGRGVELSCKTPHAANHLLDPVRRTDGNRAGLERSCPHDPGLALCDQGDDPAIQFIDITAHFVKRGRGARHRSYRQDTASGDRAKPDARDHSAHADLQGLRSRRGKAKPPRCRSYAGVSGVIVTITLVAPTGVDPVTSRFSVVRSTN